MTELTVSKAVCQAFPRLRIAVVVARGFNGHEPWHEADAAPAAPEKAPGTATHWGPARRLPAPPTGRRFPGPKAQC